MEKMEIIHKIITSGLMVVVRAESEEQAVRIAQACAEGGVAALEVAFTVPGAAEVISELRKVYSKKEEIIIGAGTVLDPETARCAILAGAQYVVSPCLNLKTIQVCNRYHVPMIPGAMTVKEIVESLEAGVDLVKVFPGEILGPTFIKAVRGPLPHAKLMPTGGVSLENVEAWIKAGAVAVGVGGNLTAPAKTGDYTAITATAREFVKRINTARQK